jgi:predicted transcriptional regulator of viral defense system
MANPDSGTIYPACVLPISVCQAQNRGCGSSGRVDEMFTIPQESCSIVRMAQSHREASVRLFELAQQQQGNFTTKQAKAAGFAENTHPYHVQAGNWIREHRGIYRLALFPATDRPDLALWSLWSSNRKEEVEGVYSHQTAISLFNLSDLNPAKLHMTVPRGFRRNSEIPGILVLHYADLPASDVQTGPGYKITRPLRTILDLIESGEVERNFIRQALTQAVDRGMITRQQIRNAQLAEPTRKVIEAILRKAA